MIKEFLVAILLILIINYSFTAAVTQKVTGSGSDNATRAIVLYNLAISQLTSGDYIDAFNNLKEVRELLPTVSSVVDGFQKTFDSAKFLYTKQMIKINKLENFSTSTVTSNNKSNNKNFMTIFIYGLLGFLLFFTLTYSVLYVCEIKKSLISGFFVTFIVSLASKYGYSFKSDYEGEEQDDEDLGENLEVEEVSQEEMGKVEQPVNPEDVEDENVEEILSQLLGINEDAPKTEEEIELEEDREEEEERELSGKVQNESPDNNPNEDEKELSSETSKNTSRVLTIDNIKDPRNEMMLTVERLKDEMYQIMVALKEKEIENQDELDNALKIMYVYSLMAEKVNSDSSNPTNSNSDSSNTGGNDAE